MMRDDAVDAVPPLTPDHRKPPPSCDIVEVDFGPRRASRLFGTSGSRAPVDDAGGRALFATSKPFR